MKSLSFWVAKGGVGKTTSAGNISHALARQGVRVLAIDADPQGNLSSWLLSRPPDNEFADVLFGECAPLTAVVKAREGLGVIATYGLGGRLEQWAETRAPAEPFAIADLLDTIERLDVFDVVVFDLGPGTSTFGKLINSSVDMIIPVMLPEYFSVDGFQILNDYVEELHRKRRSSVRVGPTIANRVHNGYATHTVYKDLAQHVIGQSTDISDCVAQNQTLVEYAPRNKWVKEYDRIAGGLIGA